MSVNMCGCPMNTGGTIHAADCPLAKPVPPLTSVVMAPRGWICPRCERVWAPFVAQCSACPPLLRLDGQP